MFQNEKEHFFHYAFSDYYLFFKILVLKSGFSPHRFKEEPLDHNCRQMLKSWENHIVRIKYHVVSSHDEKSIPYWSKRAYGEKK